jgi:acyl carrier protein
VVSEEIIVTVNKILTEDFEVEASLLKPESRLNEDIGLDSLDGVDLIVAIEEKFECRIREEEARDMKTLQDIYDSIKRYTEAGK